MSSKNPLLALMAAVTCFLEFVCTILEETDNWVPYMDDLLKAAAALDIHNTSRREGSASKHYSRASISTSIRRLCETKQ